MDVPLYFRLRAWRRGFFSQSYLLYDLDQNDYRNFLPDVARFPQAHIEGKLGRILVDKMLFASVAGSHVRVPRVLALIGKGRIHATDPAHGVCDTASLLQYCEQSRGVIIKPAQGERGQGVGKVQADRGTILLNGKPTDQDDIERWLRRLDDFIITEIIEQAEYASRIFPDSANTLRIVTMRDPDEDGRPFIPVATHRFGVRESVPTDNWSRGGLDAKVDLVTGRLGPAKRDPRISSTTLVRHPDTGSVIEGVTIPRWEEVVATVLRLADTFSFLTFVGWDVIVADDGVVVIEGNNPPDRVIQKEHPFMADARVRRFFAKMRSH